MTIIASDTFTGSTGTELSAHDAAWSHATGFTGDAQITAAGRLRATSATAASYYHSASPSSADYTVRADFYYASTSGTPGASVTARQDTSADTRYQFGPNETSGSVNGVTMTKRVAGVSTQLGRTTGMYGTTGTTYPIEFILTGTTLEGYFNGSLEISTTDSAITAAGKAGVAFGNTSAPADSTTYHLDNWEAEEAGGTNGTANGSTLLAPRTIVAGTATGDASATGATLLAPRTIIGGGATAGTNGTATGATWLAPRTIVAGTATGDASAAGATWLAPRTIIGGGASAGGSGTANGDTILAARTIVAGTATGQRNETALGAVLTTARTLIGGGAFSDLPGGTPLWRFIGLVLGRVGL